MPNTTLTPRLDLDAPVNGRSIPEDLRRRRYSTRASVAVAPSAVEATRAVERLLDAGFTERQLILVGEGISTLRPRGLTEGVEVTNPIDVAQSTGRTAGVAVGAGSGASIGVLAAFFLAASFPVFALGGAALGALAGALIGPWTVSLTRRGVEQPFASTRLDGILVGVGIESEEDCERLVVARDVLVAEGLEVHIVTGFEC